jgi:hypothetical protein
MKVSEESPTHKHYSQIQRKHEGEHSCTNSKQKQISFKFKQVYKELHPL